MGEDGFRLGAAGGNQRKKTLNVKLSLMPPSPHSLHLASNEPSKAALRTIARVREDIAACGVQEFNGCAVLNQAPEHSLAFAEVLVVHAAKPHESREATPVLSIRVSARLKLSTDAARVATPSVVHEEGHPALSRCR